ATAVDTSSAVARKTTAKPPITRDRSPPIACRSFPHHQVIPDVDVLVDHDDPFRDDGSYAHSLSHPRPHGWPVPPRHTAGITSVSSQFGGGGVVGERWTGRSDSPRCERTDLGADGTGTALGLWPSPRSRCSARARAAAAAPRGRGSQHP